MKHNLQEQIQCVAREIALRKNVYPKWVASGKMKNEEATRQIELMEAVIETLKALDEYGGFEKIYHKVRSEKRYKERMANDPEFRQDRLRYFKEYYQQHKERIKLRNIKKAISMEAI